MIPFRKHPFREPVFFESLGVESIWVALWLVGELLFDIAISITALLDYGLECGGWKPLGQYVCIQ